MQKGMFGQFGGQYTPELTSVLNELETAYNQAMNDESFINEYNQYLKEYVNRPSLLYYAKAMSEDLGGAKIYLKREDMNHTGSHKLNNVIGQVLLARYMGKKKVIAETGAGSHGVAVATVASLFNMDCEIYMGKEDIERQSLNVFKMELLGAKVISVNYGSATLKEACDEAIKVWCERCKDTFYVLGSAVGPHPYPTMVRNFQHIISKESKQQCLAKEGKLPDYVIACVGGGSNAIGSFYDYLDNPEVTLIGCEAAGKGIDTPYHAAAINKGSEAILHGMKSIFLQDENGEVASAYTISAGLDYPGVGPELAYLHESKRAQYVAINDQEAVDAFLYLTKMEGIIPAIESSHALAYAMKLAPTLPKDKVIIVTLSGRGDKDVKLVADFLNIKVDD